MRYHINKKDERITREKETLEEIPLQGGQLTLGIVRIGSTVRRPPKSNATFVHNLLLFLEEQGFDFAPRFLGMDEQGREVLSYLEGQMWPGSGSSLSDDLLIQAAQIIRRLHDITAGSQLAQGHEIVAHQELGPHNTIFQENQLVGFIDWDDAAPGTRLRDLANAVYNYVDVGHWTNQTADEQARRIRLMCIAYGWDDPIAIVNDFEADLQQALRNHEQAGRKGAIKIFQEEVSWMCLRDRSCDWRCSSSLVHHRHLLKKHTPLLVSVRDFVHTTFCIPLSHYTDRANLDHV